MNPEDYAKSGKESSHQTALFMWIALNKNAYPELEMLFAIKNEEKSGSALVGIRSKAAGVKKGASDLFLPVARQNCHVLFIEMKKPGGKASREQLEFGAKVQSKGYGFCVCDSWEKARDVLIQYLKK